MPLTVPKMPAEVQERLNDGSIGPYKILSTIGAGGMGAVFRCRDAKLRREVAVKLLLAPSDGKNIERFLSEARTMARLSHPNVVQVHDVGYDGHVPYFVMELVEGESLAQKLDRLGRLPIEEVRDILVQCASGLAAVHKLGIIHRDVKAANIIETSDGDVKLLDFGIARPVEHAPQLTSAGLVMGTPSSMSPEQLRGEELDQRADVYALGVLVYQLLTGQRPYEGDDPSDLARKQEAAPYKPVKELRTDVAVDLEKILDKTLAQAKEERFWNCEEILHALGVERHGTIGMMSHVASGGATVRPFVRKRPKELYIAGAFLIAALALVGWRRTTNGCVFVCDHIPGAEGRPMIETYPAGVFLWHDGFGWHLRAKSTDTAREISGAIRVTGGVLERAAGIDAASGDAITVEGRHSARFHFEDPGTQAGLDFIANEGCVELLATSKDVPIPDLVRIGADATIPRSLPFRICR